MVQICKYQFMSKTIRDVVLLSPKENQNYDRACRKPSNMRPPGDSTVSAGCSKRDGSAEKLHQKPDAQKDKSRQLDNPDEIKNRNQCQHSCFGIEESICAHDASDRATGANGWHWRCGIGVDVCQSGDDTTE